MAIRLFVGNLPYNVTEAELREYFSSVGPLSYISIPTDRETGKQRGFAFLEFKDRAQADEAIRRFNNQSFKGRSLSVNEARAKDERPPGGAPSRPSPSRPAPTSSRPAPASSRPAPVSPRHDPAAAPDSADPSGGNKPSRKFGPDASSRRSRDKTKSGLKADRERTPKGPMREVVRGQFFYDGDEDDDDDYDYDDDDDAGEFDDAETGEEQTAERNSDLNSDPGPDPNRTDHT